MDSIYSPDGTRLVYHLASPQGYQIWTSDPFGQQRQLVAAHDDWLFFGPKWSPDGAWLAYQGCLYKGDPGHDWADLWIARPDGSQQRRLTSDQALWFAASYGPREAPRRRLQYAGVDARRRAHCLVPHTRRARAMDVSAATAGCGSLQSGFCAGTGAGRSADTPL